MDYASWKLLHQGSVALSVSGFAGRDIGSLAGAAWMLQLNPLTTPWLAAKISGLLLYIGLGVVALRTGRPLALRIGAWLAALLVFGWIVSVAITKDPLGLLRPFAA